MKVAALALALALPIAAQADLVTVTIDLQDPASHLELSFFEHAIAFFGDGVPAGSIPGWYLSSGFDLTYWGTSTIPQLVVSESYEQNRFRLPPGPHAEADIVYIPGPVVPADAHPARFATITYDTCLPCVRTQNTDAINLRDRWRLTGHLSADLDNGWMTLTQTGQFSFYDAATNSGWVLPFTNMFQGRTAGFGGVFTVIDGPTAALVTPVPELEVWASLLLALAFIGLRVYR